MIFYHVHDKLSHLWSYFTVPLYRKAGFEIRLVEETCEHYAVIDRNIVWYGSMNLLSKEDAEDNLMRVCSKDIAAELLEMTFGSEADMQKW